VPGHPYSLEKTLAEPAQLPHRSMFAMMDWFLKCEDMSQSVLGKSATGVPHCDGSGEESLVEVKSEGTEVRSNVHMRMPASRNSIAKSC
jgi:hypothetical protein